MPGDISLNSISITEGQLQLRASALSENSIAQFLVNLEKDNTFKDTNLSQVSTSTENSNLTLFTITGRSGVIPQSKKK